ncbi:bifunctional methylenetetrahydrofolate dehydrogenase/methenyltetrahydrofolate cyclohydrolase FolD, partial [SCandidatus Aminicenantes bacterium Aminicenantia_JdfR_composite]|nr:bifunctional methylenetetrahydrofolate dehydrogenase/methenyltetrahydrofolate cyclohydrolase FolD [SCandidatus Aminicenantes bacterium Aminicenantia_JdfR_composite]
LVGDDPASKIYLSTKAKNCERLGISSEIFYLPENTSFNELAKKINKLNKDDEVDGILVQLPLPSHLDTFEVICAISPEKDVDGFHPHNLGKILHNEEGLRACTPLGIIELLKSNNIPLEGTRVVVIGRSLIVGKPLAAMLTNENATVTICHSKTRNLSEVASEADILIVAIGKPAFVTSNFVKEGAVVVDVGVNRVSDRNKIKELFGDNKEKEEQFEKKGYIIIGDVHPEVINKASYLTPVPGGVGPLTVAMLLKNTLKAFKKRNNLE